MSGGPGGGQIMKKMNASALLAGMRSNTLIAGLFIFLLVSMVLLFANFAYVSTQADYDNEYLGHAGELRVLSQRIAKNAVEAAAGTPEAFVALKEARDEFNQRWGYLSQGNSTIGLPAVPDSLQVEVSEVQQDWDTLRQNTDAILASEQTVLSLHQVATTLAETIPQLQVEYEEVVDILLESNAPAVQV